MIGRILGFAGLCACLWVIYHFEGSSAASSPFRLFHWPALVLTGVGPFWLVLLAYGFGPLFRVLGLGAFGSPGRERKRSKREAMYLQTLSREFYEKGPTVFEAVKTNKMSPFTKKVLERLSIRMPTADVRELATVERDRAETDYSPVLSAVAASVRLTPSIGMLGTIMGMVRLLATLEDPSRIGSHMSTALLTTFYGLFFSLAIWTPVQQKIEKIVEARLEGCDQALRWLELMERRKPDSYFEDVVGISKQKRKTG